MELESLPTFGFAPYNIEFAKSGITPLTPAALLGHEDIVRLLLEKGANIEPKDLEKGRTPRLRGAAYERIAIFCFHSVKIERYAQHLIWLKRVVLLARDTPHQWSSLHRLRPRVKSCLNFGKPVAQ
jgi:ankyrin repeat protein